MRKISLVFFAWILMQNLVFAYLLEIKILTKEEIAKLSDQALMDTYLDVVVELEATKTFHVTSGFTPKDYKAFKEVLRYRILLIQEIHKRKLDIPPVE